MKNEEHFFYRTMVPQITSKDFDDNGLRWPLSHLSMVFPEIIFWPVIVMAEFTDRVTFEIITKSNKEELHLLLTKITFQPIDYEHQNATSMGNLGFVATYAQDDALRATAYTTIMRIREKTIDLARNSAQDKQTFKKILAEA